MVKLYFLCIGMYIIRARPVSLSLSLSLSRYSVTDFEDHFWIACLSYFLDPNMCGFQYICRVLSDPPLIPNSSGPLAELIDYIISPE